MDIFTKRYVSFWMLLTIYVCLLSSDGSDNYNRLTAGLNLSQDSVDRLLEDAEFELLLGRPGLSDKDFAREIDRLVSGYGVPKSTELMHNVDGERVVAVAGVSTAKKRRNRRRGKEPKVSNNVEPVFNGADGVPLRLAKEAVN